MEAAAQAALVGRLLDPGCYDHPVASVRRVETHISHVLLTGDYAYKIKKPLNLGFLDFTTLEQRRRLCEEEVRLNRRLAPEYYLGIVAIAGTPERPRLGELERWSEGEFARRSSFLETSMTELVFREDAYAATCTATVTAVDERGIQLDRTVFYPLGGGQAGDTGVLALPDGSEVRIVDTVKGEGPDDVLHVAAPGSALPPPGTRVEARIDRERRHRLMRLHTCLHLLCAVVPAPVTGGKILEDKAHLDFDIEMEKLDRDAIEARLNALIEAGHPVEPQWISDEELDAKPELVRTMSVKPPRGQGRVRVLNIPGVDLQPCGGTHVRNTREIGRVQVVRIKSEGKRNRRVTVALA